MEVNIKEICYCCWTSELLWRGRTEIFVVLIIVCKTVIWLWAVIVLGGLKFQNGDDKLCQISERFYGFLLATRDRGDFWQLLKILKFEYPYSLYFQFPSTRFLLCFHNTQPNTSVSMSGWRSPKGEANCIPLLSHQPWWVRARLSKTGRQFSKIYVFLH